MTKGIGIRLMIRGCIGIFFGLQLFGNIRIACIRASAASILAGAGVPVATPITFRIPGSSNEEPPEKTLWRQAYSMRDSSIDRAATTLKNSTTSARAMPRIRRNQFWLLVKKNLD